jgi:hypothetical protein
VNLIVLAIPFDAAKDRGAGDMLGAEEFNDGRVHGLKTVAIGFVDEDPKQLSFFELEHSSPHAASAAQN